MERIYNCILCARRFKVMNELPQMPPDVLEEELTIDCPFCNTPNLILWPVGATYMIGK